MVYLHWRYQAKVPQRGAQMTIATIKVKEMRKFANALAEFFFRN